MMTDIGKEVRDRPQLSIIEANVATFPDVGDNNDDPAAGRSGLSTAC